MDMWWATIRIMAHSSGRGAEIDQASVGPRTALFRIQAEHIEGATAKAHLICEGIRLNPMAWNVQVTSVTSDRPDADTDASRREGRVGSYHGDEKQRFLRILSEASSRRK